MADNGQEIPPDTNPANTTNPAAPEPQNGITEGTARTDDAFNRSISLDVILQSLFETQQRAPDDSNNDNILQITRPNVLRIEEPTRRILRRVSTTRRQSNNTANSQTPQMQSPRHWFHHSISRESINGDSLYNSLRKFRESQCGLFKKHSLDIYSIMFSKRFRCIVQYIFIIYALINIGACLFVKRLMKVDVFGLKFINFTLNNADLNMYLSIDMQAPPNVFDSSMKPRSIPWSDQSCFNFYAFEDNELMPLIYSGSLWTLNTLQNFKPSNQIKSPPKSMYIVLNFNPFCYRLNHPILRFIFTNYIGVYPLINNEISKYLELKPVNEYKHLNYQSDNMFLYFFANMSQWLTFGLLLSLAKNCLSAFYIDFVTFANVLNVDRSSRLLCLMTGWLFVITGTISIPVLMYISLLDIGIVINFFIGELFTLLLLNKATYIFWSQIFHLVNFFTFLVLVFNPKFHIRLVFMTGHSILFAVGFVLVNELNLPYLSQMNRYGIFRQPRS